MTDTGEIEQTEVEAAIEQAYHVENDPEKAGRLYQRLIGSTDREGEISPAPVVDVDVPDEGQAESIDELAGPSPDDIQGAAGRTSFDDYVAYSSLAEHEQDEIFDTVLELADPDTSRGLLQRFWPGDEYAANLAFSAALVEAVPGSLEAVRVLEAVGMIDHPAIVKWMVAAGRLMATTSGDPATIPTTTGDQTMDSTMTGNIQAQIEALEAQIEALEEQIEKATALNDTEKSNALYARQQGLYRLLPGGTDPAVGEGGRTI